MEQDNAASSSSPHRAVSPEEPLDNVAVASSTSQKMSIPITVESIPIGGEIATPAYALLEGVVYGKNVKGKTTTAAAGDTEQSASSCCTKIRVPIRHIPATLGRSHDTDDTSFYGLSAIKALSREQCRIYYQEPQNGGRLALLDNNNNDDDNNNKDGKFVYQPAPTSKQQGGTSSSSGASSRRQRQDVIPLDPNKPLPPEGFFVIECVGKNKITVGTNRVEQGQVAQLDSGTKIRMSTVCLVFLLPTDNKRITMEIPSSTTTMTAASVGTTTTSSRKAVSSSSSSTIKRKRPSSTNNKDNDGLPDAKRQSTTSGGNVAMIQELEQLTSDELLAEMREAVESGTWERRHQLSGGVIAYHAVRDASRSKAIRTLARETDGGVSRKEIIDWMRAAPKYAFWVTNTLERVEISSFQSTISRVLLKAGYERLGKNGRYVKWKLPPSVEVESEVSDNDVVESSDDESSKSSDHDVTMKDDVQQEEEASGDDDDDEVDEKDSEPDQAIAEENELASDDDDDSSDEDQESTTKPAPSNLGNAPIEQESSDDDDDDDEASNVSSQDEMPAATMAGQEKDDVAESDEVSARSSESGEDLDGAMRGTEQAMGPGSDSLQSE